MTVSLPLPNSDLRYEDIIPIQVRKPTPVTFHTDDYQEALDHAVKSFRLSNARKGKLRANTHYCPVVFGFVHRGVECLDKIGEIEAEVSADELRVNYTIYTCESDSAKNNRIRARFQVPNKPEQFDQIKEIFRCIYRC